MNQAVGKPTAKVVSVVRIESFSERQKIVRCASARTYSSLKMSFVQRMPRHPPSEKPHSTLPYFPGRRKE